MTVVDVSSTSDSDMNFFADDIVLLLLSCNKESRSSFDSFQGSFKHLLLVSADKINVYFKEKK